MPTTKEDLPSTIERSAAKVRRTYVAALDSAHEEYAGDEERAHRTAWAAVKQVAEKVGDHWEVKPEPGRSDEGGPRGGTPTAESTRPRPRPSYTEMRPRRASAVART